MCSATELSSSGLSKHSAQIAGDSAKADAAYIMPAKMHGSIPADSRMMICLTTPEDMQEKSAGILPISLFAEVGMISP